VSTAVTLGALALTAASWHSPSWSRLTRTTPAAASASPSNTADGPLVVGGTDPEATRRGLNALSTIAYPWASQLPGWEIRFHRVTDGAYGYTLSREHRIDIYVRDLEPEELLIHVIAHELGHAVDLTHNGPDERQRWLELRGAAGSPWWPDNRAADFATGAGDFAESFAAWQTGSDREFRSQLAPPPTPEQRAVLSELAAGG
jgi:hypothetical protein